jgi:hypothetical protein
LLVEGRPFSVFLPNTIFSLMGRLIYRVSGVDKVAWHHDDQQWHIFITGEKNPLLDGHASLQVKKPETITWTATSARTLLAV